MLFANNNNGLADEILKTACEKLNVWWAGLGTWQPIGVNDLLESVEEPGNSKPDSQARAACRLCLLKQLCSVTLRGEGSPVTGTNAKVF